MKESNLNGDNALNSEINMKINWETFQYKIVLQVDKSM